MTTATGEQRFTGWHMLGAALLFFGVIIAVNVGMAVVASTSWTGLVVANSYVASQEFEENRLAHEAQREAGWTPVLGYDGGTVRLAVPDAAGQPVELGVVSVLFNRPVGGHDDRTIVLSRGGDGDYVGDADLAAGIWEATASAPSTALGRFELHTRFRVKDDTP
jgi:nitrogen fixation protein FixH